MMAFIVDGQLEKRAIERLCERRVPIRTPNLNGRCTIAAIAARIDTLLKLLGDAYPVFVIFDREQRVESSQFLEGQLLDSLIALGNDQDRLRVICADKMIENWIIAGTASYRGFSLACCSVADADGTHGKALLKDALKDHNIAYNETTIGVEMLCALSAKLASSKSESFARFLAFVTPFCHRWASK